MTKFKASVKKKNNFRLQIKLANGNKIVFSKAYVYLNLNLENTWKSIEPNALMADENLLLKIEDLADHKAYFLILQDVTIFVDEKNISVTVLNDLKVYSENKKTTVFKNGNTDFLKLKEELYYYKLRQNIGLNLKEMIDLRKLKNDLFIQKAIKAFGLTKMENLNEKKIN